MLRIGAAVVARYHGGMRILLACAVISLAACDSGGGEDAPPDACASAECRPTGDAAVPPVDAGADASTCQGADCSDLFVAAGGTGAACSKQAPCGRIADALALRSATRTRIHVAAAAYRESVLITGTGEVSLLGPETGLVDLSPDTDTSVVTVRGDLRVTLVGFDIHGGRGRSTDPFARHGVVCQLNGRQSPHVTLERVIVRDNPAHGFDALRCGITAERTTFRKNGLGGIAAHGAFTVRNSFLVDNGTEGNPSSAGGFSLVLEAGLTSVFEFNTVAGNHSFSGGAGVNAAGSTGAFANNIVFGNKPMAAVADGLREAVGGTWSYSIFGGTRVPVGATNRAVDPLFESAAAGNYTLSLTSPAINAADPQATNPIDWDGTARPVGGRSDIGADERVLPI